MLTMRSLLNDLAPYVVVVGSVCRGKQNPKDLDLLFDFDNDRSFLNVREIIKRHAIPFKSVTIGCWCFNQKTITPNGGCQIEVLYTHYGKSYKACRRAGQKSTFWGVELIVAPAHYSQSRTDHDAEKISRS